MTTKIDVINLVLNEIGRPPIANIMDSNDALLISFRLDSLLPILLTKANWTFAIKYVVDNTPLVTNFNDQFNFTYQLPADYGHMMWANQTLLEYMIVDGLFLSNEQPFTYYYVVNNIDYNFMTPYFIRALVLYTAYTMCMVLTNNANLTSYLKLVYEEELNKAIIQNDIERRVEMMPYNDFDRITFI